VEPGWDSVLSADDEGRYHWFAGAEANTCWNALDRHVRDGRGEQVALIYDSPLTGALRKFTYRELLDLVARFAGGLAGLGVGKGDRVLLYMPVIPEAVVAMLACARIGAVHSVVFGGFAAREVATRIIDAQPKLIVTRPAASSPTASSPICRRSTPRSRWPAACPTPAWWCSARAAGRTQARPRP